MRKLAGTITPCQSKAAATRFMRSPPAAKNVATTSTATRARTAKGSRRASRGIGVPALSVLAARKARSTWARHSAMRKRIFGRSGDLVGDRGGRPMGQAGVTIEPPEAVHPARDAQHQERGERRGGEQKENTETDRPPDRGQPQPEPKPGDGQEQADHRGDRRQRRPQPLPENRPARTTERPRQHGIARRLTRWRGAGWRGGRVRRVRGPIGQVCLQQRESGRLPILTRN